MDFYFAVRSICRIFVAIYVVVANNSHCQVVWLSVLGWLLYLFVFLPRLIILTGVIGEFNIYSQK